MPSGETAFYDEYWEPRDGWSPSGGSVGENERRLFARHLRPGKVCLDYGCGDAARYGALLNKEGIDYRGADVSAAAVAAAQARGINAQILDSEGRTSLADGSCEVVLCFEVLEHLLQPNLALAEIRRVLKPGGVAVLSVPNAALWTTRLEFLLTGFFNPGGSPRTARATPWLDPHIRFLNPRLFRKMVESEGLRVLGESAEPFSLLAAPYLYRKQEWHPWLQRLSAPLAFLGTVFPGLFSARLFIEAVKPSP